MNKDGKPEDKNAELREQVDQLKKESQIERKKVSECIKDLMAYCQQNKGGDILVSGPSAGVENPFSDKKKCSML